MRSGGMLGAELEKSSAPRCDIEGSSRAQLKVVIWAVMVDMFGKGGAVRMARVVLDAPHYVCTCILCRVGVRLYLM